MVKGGEVVRGGEGGARSKRREKGEESGSISFVSFHLSFSLLSCF